MPQLSVIPRFYYDDFLRFLKSVPISFVFARYSSPFLFSTFCRTWLVVLSSLTLSLSQAFFEIYISILWYIWSRQFKWLNHWKQKRKRKKLTFYFDINRKSSDLLRIEPTTSGLPGMGSSAVRCLLCCLLHL